MVVVVVFTIYVSIVIQLLIHILTKNKQLTLSHYFSP
uniref:Uncharacterized protein n=1 Tax=Arundo donax TaxID=35708 RepID=A0A0A9BC33_ARUDO